MRRLLYAIFGLIAIITFLIAFLFISRFFGGGGGIPPVVGIAGVIGVVTSSTRFWVLFILGALVLAIWATVNYVFYPAGTGMTQRLRGMSPPAWAFAILLGVTAFHWLFWAISPEAWSAWLSSQTFWPMNVAIVLAAFFASQQGRAAGYASFALWMLLLIAVGIGAYGYLPWSTWLAGVGSGPIGQVSPIPTSSTTMILRPEKPVTISVLPGHRWDLVGKIPTKGWTTGDGYRDKHGNRIQVFEIVPPEKEVSLEVKISKCITPQMCAW